MIATARETPARGKMAAVPIEMIAPWPELNPRTFFRDSETNGLAESLREVGMMAPIHVAAQAGGGKYFIVMGERRWRAAKIAGWTKMLCVVHAGLTEAEALKMALVENLQREDLTAIQEARAIMKMMRLEPNLSQSAIGKRLGKGQPWVSNRLRLLDLPASDQNAIEKREIHATHARDYLLPKLHGREPYDGPTKRAGAAWGLDTSTSNIVRELRELAEWLEGANADYRQCVVDAIALLESRSAR